MHNRVFISLSRVVLWAEALDIRRRHPVIRTAKGDKARRNLYERKNALSSFGYRGAHE